MTVGEKIKAARLKKGYSQTELAQLLGYKSRSSINKIEVDGRDIPKSSIVKFAQVLDVSPAYLMGWEEPKDTNRQWYEIEEKLRFIGYKIGFYEEDAIMWIEFPDGTLEVTEQELMELNRSSDDFLKFKINELKNERKDDFIGFIK